MSPKPIPSPTPTPSPSDAAAGSSTGSAAASEPGGFIGNPGPAFEPPAEPQLAPAPEQMPEVEASWKVGQVKDMLRIQGRATHSFIGISDEDWVHTDADLAAIAPPLTRILNRYPATAAAAVIGDEMLLVTGVSAYAMRSYGQRRAELQRRDKDPAQRPQPVTGVTPDPPAGVEGEPLPAMSDLPGAI